MLRGVVGSLLFSLLAGAALADGWIVDKANGCGTSNPFPKPNEAISWRGGCRDGKLDGQGTLIWYRDGIETERDQGGFRNGELDGEAVISYPDGHAIIGAYREGQRDGEFIVTKPNGQVTVSQYKSGQFISERQLSAAEATAKAPEIAAKRRQFGDVPGTRTAAAPSLPARARAKPEPVTSTPPLTPPAPAPEPVPVSSLPSITPAPPITPATPPPLPAPPPVAVTAPPAVTPPRTYAAPPMYAPPTTAAPAPFAEPPPSRARIASQPPSLAPSAVMAPDLRPTLPLISGGERIVLRPPKPRTATKLAVVEPPEPAPPPNRARAAYAAAPPSSNAPIVLRPPKAKSATPPRGSVWIDEAALPPPRSGIAGPAPVLRPPGQPRSAARAPRPRPAAQLEPPRLSPPLALPLPVATTAPIRPASSAPVLRPPPLTPAVVPPPLSPPRNPLQPAPPVRPGGPSARAAEPTARYALSLSNAELPHAARAILGDALGERYSIDAGVVANVTLTPAAPLGRDELLQAFGHALLVQGVALGRDGDGWRLSQQAATAGTALPQLAARVDGPAPALPLAPATDAESRFVAGFGLERSGRNVEAMQAYNALISAYPDTPAAALARERLAVLAQRQAQQRPADSTPPAPAAAALGARSHVGQYLCTAPGLFGAGSLWCGHVRAEDAERYEIQIRRVSVGGLFSVGFSRAPCTGDTFISQFSVGNRVTVPKGCMAP